jgi:hypothetical protein
LVPAFDSGSIYIGDVRHKPYTILDKVDTRAEKGKYPYATELPRSHVPTTGGWHDRGIFAFRIGRRPALDRRGPDPGGGVVISELRTESLEGTRPGLPRCTGS